jgi:hypothetical protein
MTLDKDIDAIVRKLVDALESARNGFINLRPEGGPMHRQMTKHIDAIAATLDGCEKMARELPGVLPQCEHVATLLMPFDHWWDSWVGSDGDGPSMEPHRVHARAAWHARVAVHSQGNPHG